MKKNNKGFTLVELLAAIVILGILMAIAVPTIINMINNNRNKIYITDAKKLVAQAEYKIRASGSTIDKPDEGDCIIISLVFLDNSDFDSPPNDGEYLSEASYVVVKNTGDGLEYSVTLIEQMKKGGYKGVELTSSSNLSKSDALSHVKVFEKSDLIYVESSNMSETVINNYLGNSYCNEIEAVYNYPDLADSAVKEVNEAPKIKKATLSSASNKSFNTLDAKLEVKATDDITATSSLKVCTSIKSYDDADKNGCELYGSSDNYVKSFDFSKSNTYDGNKIILYLIVKDEDNNSTKKQINYVIHQNQAPNITTESCSITKRSFDTVNRFIANVKLVVADDVDSTEDLQVCFSEDADATSCSNYKSYKTYFGDGNTYTYQFTCGGTCTLDGRTVKLKIFVKDSSNDVSTVTLPYTFYKNEPPVVKKFKVTSRSDGNPSSGNINTIVTLDVSDDISTDSNINITLSGGAETKNLKLSDFKNGYNYQISSASFPYNGDTKKITVVATDEDGASTEVSTDTFDYSLYKNKVPTINSFSITSNGIACTANSSSCYDSNNKLKGGSVDSFINFKISDDLDDDSSLSLCFADVSTSNLSDVDRTKICKSDQYHPYSYYENGFGHKFSDATNPYDGSTKYYMMCVKDTYGEEKCQINEYKLYNNQAPVISNASIESNDESFISDVSKDGGSKNVSIKVTASDDITNTSDLIVTIRDVTDENNVITNTYNYTDGSIAYTIDGDYDGKKHKIQVIVTDSYNTSSSKDFEYTLYTNKAPEVNASVKSTGVACSNENLCNIETYGGNKNVSINVTATDDIDDAGDLKVCVSENEKSGCTKNDLANYSDYSDYNSDDGKSYTFANVNENYSNVSNQNKTLYISVMDNDGGITTNAVTYKLYKNIGPVVSSGYPSVDSNDNQLGSFTYKIAAIDDFDDTSNLEIKTCYKDSAGKETCLDSSYVPFTIDSDGVYINENYNITVPTNSGYAYYDGQVYTIYSYIKDTAGNITESNSVTYTLKENQDPIIQDTAVSNSKSLDSDSEFNSKTAYIHFVVSDEDDYVYACVSEDSSTCTNYSSTLFDGSSLDTYTVTYTNNNWTYDGSKKTLYLFIKDRKGRIVTSSGLSYTLYKECDKTNSEDTNASYTAVNSNDKISASKCSGKCYYWETVYSTDVNGNYLDKNKSIVYKVDGDGNLLNTAGKIVYTVDSDGNYLDSSKKVVDKSVVFKDVDVILAESDTAGISAKYKRTISYADKFIKDTTGSSTYCLQVKDQVYEEHCDFVDCFYNPKKSSYVSKAIGITEVTTSNIYYTYEYNGKVYSTNKYYKLYSSSYNDGDEYITLDLTGYKLLPSLVDDATGPFTYNSSSDDPYLRVLDDDTPFSGEVTLIEESNS